MVKIGSVSQNSDGGQTDVIVSLCSLGLMLCMVVVVLGIKFRWFKQRLNFEPIPTGSGGSADGGQVVLMRNSRNSQEQFREPVMAQGIFRKKLDEDVIIERPKTLPPVRVRKASKGPPSFGPPKRSQTFNSTVEEPVVIPPPPPPLPSASSVTLFSSDGSPPLFAKTRTRTNTASPDNKEDNFNSSSSPIIANGETNKTYEQLKTEDHQSDKQYTERRATGYIRPSDEIALELQEVEREPPQILPRSIISDKPKESFKKKAQKATKITTEPLKTEEDQNEVGRMNQRRLTGFFPPSDDDRESIEYISEKKSGNKVVFLLDDDDDESKSPPPPPIPITPPPTLFSSQISLDSDRNSSDSWSAIQRHRNLAQEISEQHEAMQNRRKENAEAAGPVPEFRNPLATQQQQPKPRTMRDMKRNSAKNDLLLDNDRDDTQA